MTRSKRRKFARIRTNQIDYGDLPRQELMRRADIAYRIGWDVRFKFTCTTCGARCAFADLNKLWTEGECSTCGHTTTVQQGGFALQAFQPTKLMLRWVTLPEETMYSPDLLPPVAA